MMSSFYINQNELDEVYPPITPFSSMSPEQVEILRRPLESSIVVSGGPCTGKTVLALWKAKCLVDAGNACLFIAGNSLSLKYVKHAFSDLGSPNIRCSTFFEATKEGSVYDVIILDDSQRYSIEQIQTLLSSTRFLLLFGDYYYNHIYCSSSTTIEEIRKTIVGCRVYSLSDPYGIPHEYLRLVPRFANVITVSSTRCRLPVIARIGSIEEQCLVVKQLVEALMYDNVGILCYSRNLVKEAHVSFNNIGLNVEAYLPGREDGIDTLDPGSSLPKMTTIASAYGIHFNTVFVIGFDSGIVWNNPEEVLETAATRAIDDLYIFYDKKLPDPLDSLPQSYYRTIIHDSIEP